MFNFLANKYLSGGFTDFSGYSLIPQVESEVNASNSETIHNLFTTVSDALHFLLFLVSLYLIINGALNVIVKSTENKSRGDIIQEQWNSIKWVVVAVGILWIIASPWFINIIVSLFNVIGDILFG